MDARDLAKMGYAFKARLAHPLRRPFGLFVLCAQNFAGCQINKMHPLAGKAGHGLIRVTVVGPVVRQPALHPITGARAEKENGRHGRSVIRLGNFVFEVAQIAASFF
jgi:hypothetical protein